METWTYEKLCQSVRENDENQPEDSPIFKAMVLLLGYVAFRDKKGMID